MEKWTGPSIEPWRTPQEMKAEDEEELPTEKLEDMLDKYEEKQFKAEIKQIRKYFYYANRLFSFI